MKVTRLRGALAALTLAVLIIILAVACTWILAQSAANGSPKPAAILTVDTSLPGKDFEVGALGLSTEASELATDHLSATHYRLVRLMRLLGPSVLRIGGSSVNFSWWTSSGEPPPPWASNTITPADLSSLRRLLTATGWRVLLGVDFGHFEPARSADEARYAREILGADLLGFEIGNEPNGYSSKRERGSLRPPTYDVSEYLREAEEYRQALSAATPDVAVYGPATGGAHWLTEMGAAADMFTELTEHYYPTSTCPDAPSSEPPPTVKGLLSPAVGQQENETLEALARAGAIADRPTRIGETNSISYCSESAHGAPTLASALWAFDWALRAASKGVKGVSFQSDFGTCGSGSESQSPICAPSREAANAGDVTPQPEYCGLLAASQLEGGRMLPTSLTSRRSLRLTAWATIAPGGMLTIAIDDLAIAGPDQAVSVAIPGYSAGTVERLTGPSASATAHVSLGSASVTADGKWRPKPAKLPPLTNRSFRVAIRPASAVVIRLYRQHKFG